MSEAILRYYGSTVSFMPTKSLRRIQHARKMLRVHTSRRKFKQVIRGILAHI
jgi:hypothetical protein